MTIVVFASLLGPFKRASHYLSNGRPSKEKRSLAFGRNVQAKMVTERLQRGEAKGPCHYV